MQEMTFAERDRLEADRQRKRVELVGRLSKVLAAEFTLNELRFIQGIEFDSIRTEAYEIARGKARG